jgi:hypothetical protein
LRFLIGSSFSRIPTELDTFMEPQPSPPLLFKSFSDALRGESRVRNEDIEGRLIEGDPTSNEDLSIVLTVKCAARLMTMQNGEGLRDILSSPRADIVSTLATSIGRKKLFEGDFGSLLRLLVQMAQDENNATSARTFMEGMLLGIEEACAYQGEGAVENLSEFAGFLTTTGKEYDWVINFASHLLSKLLDFAQSESSAKRKTFVDISAIVYGFNPHGKYP